MKNKYITASVTALLCVAAMFFGKKFLLKDYSYKTIKVGFVYIGDAGNAYTNNFIRAQIELEEALKEKIQTVAKYNILESDCDNAIYDLIEKKCDLIFTTSLNKGRIRTSVGIIITASTIRKMILRPLNW